MAFLNVFESTNTSEFSMRRNLSPDFYSSERKDLPLVDATGEILSGPFLAGQSLPGQLFKEGTFASVHVSNVQGALVVVQSVCRQSRQIARLGGWRLRQSDEKLKLDDLMRYSPVERQALFRQCGVESQYSLTLVEVDTPQGHYNGDNKPMAGHRVLVITTDELLRQEIQNAARSLGLMVDFVLDSRLDLRFCELGIPHMVIIDERLRDDIFDELIEELRKTDPNYPFIEIASASNVLEMAGWMSDSMTRISHDGLRNQPIPILAMELLKVGRLPLTRRQSSTITPLPQQWLSNNMSSIPVKQSTHALLREKAESSISGGSAPATHGWTIGAASLTLLHRLASDPATASDALKMLHELQVHQVELDLQHEHMNDERLEMEQATLRLVEMYVFAPIAYFMVSSIGQIAEGNLQGARMMGVERDDLQEHNITRLVDPGSRAALLDMLELVSSSRLPQRCQVQALDTTRHRRLDVMGTASPSGQHCLVAVIEVANDHSPALQALN